MTLKEQLAELKDRLNGLKDRIEANDEAAITEGVALKADIEAKEKEIQTAEQKAAVLEVIGEKKEKNTMNEKEGLKSLDLEALKGQRGTVSTYIKAATDPQTKPTITEFSQEIVEGDEGRYVRDLFSNENISGNSYSWVTLGALEGTPAATAEGAAKPQVHVVQAQPTQALTKIAAYLKETDELLNDAPYLASAIQNRGVAELRDAIEDYIITTLLATSGVQQGANTITFDNLFAAKSDIYADTKLRPDAIVINPADWSTLATTKDDAKQYLLGGPGFGAYGNGSYTENPRVWGLEVIESSAVPQGKCIVGAFRRGASVVGKAGEGLRVEVSNSNEDDFVKNLVTVRIEERLLLAVRVPAAFEIVGA